MSLSIHCCGNVVLDQVLMLDQFPCEDSEQRVQGLSQRTGGNIANTMNILRQFGNQVTWFGVLPDNTVAHTLSRDLQSGGVKTRIHWLKAHYQIPTSYILLNRHNGSRTILHNREMPEMTYEQFQQLEPDASNWFHFEIRNPVEQFKMIAAIRHNWPGVTISIEMEKKRDQYEQLIPLVDYVFYSRHFANQAGFASPDNFFNALDCSRNKACFLAWGALGAGFKKGDENCWHHCRPISAVDTIGAGDVFNAGLIHYLASGKNEIEALNMATELATTKCERSGLENLVRQSL